MGRIADIWGQIFLFLAKKKGGNRDKYGWYETFPGSGSGHFGTGRDGASRKGLALKAPEPPPWLG